jgi:putative ABC transport system ATP-binding protein
LVPQTNGESKEDSEKFAMELLEYFDIADKAHSLSSELSGG